MSRKAEKEVERDSKTVKIRPKVNFFLLFYCCFRVRFSDCEMAKPAFQTLIGWEIQSVQPHAPPIRKSDSLSEPSHERRTTVVAEAGTRVPEPLWAGYREQKARAAGRQTRAASKTEVAVGAERNRRGTGSRSNGS